MSDIEFVLKCAFCSIDGIRCFACTSCCRTSFLRDRLVRDVSMVVSMSDLSIK